MKLKKFGNKQEETFFNERFTRYRGKYKIHIKKLQIRILDVTRINGNIMQCRFE